MEPGIHFCRHNPVFLNSCPQKEAFKAQVAYSNCVQFFTQFLRAKCIMSSSVSAYVPSQNAKSKSFFFPFCYYLGHSFQANSEFFCIWVKLTWLKTELGP